MAASASAVSRLAMASMASANWASARPPIWATLVASDSSCSVKALTVCSLIASFPAALAANRALRSNRQRACVAASRRRYDYATVL
jgi:hypothetical protein